MTEDQGPEAPLDRDPETGKFVKGRKGHDSETAKRIGALGGRRTKRDLDADVTALLAEVGYGDPEDAPRALLLLATEFAKGKVHAATAFLRATRQETSVDVITPPPPEPGKRCVTCGTFNLSMDLDLAQSVDDDTYKLLVAYMHAVHEYLHSREKSKPTWNAIAQATPATTEKGPGHNSQVQIG